MATLLRSSRCPLVLHRLGGVTMYAAISKSERLAQGLFALQATICIEQWAQTTHRAVRWRSVCSGSDLGGPLARTADRFSWHSPDYAVTAFIKSGEHRRLRVGSQLNASDYVAVFHTAYGAFDGNSWERLCQLVFKRKFTEDGYTHIPATPGDYGLEGFTKTTGCGYQCYCPDKVYPPKELYEKQRDKITTDLKKLQTNEADLTKILGVTKLRRWHLVTPTIAHKVIQPLAS